MSYIEGTVRRPTGHAERVRFLIDSGATYSLLPAAELLGRRLARAAPEDTERVVEGLMEIIG